ncbi:hypothetical protein H0H93_003797, partial [Arthromyces matolae]
HKAKTFDDPWAVAVYNGDVVKSDHAIPTTLKEALKSAVLSLERVPEHEKDWHPGSDKKVLDLVHPSLYPLVYGKTRILPNTTIGLHDCITRCGEGETLPNPSSEAFPWHYRLDDPATNPYSTKFQWLPCEVDISGGDGQAKITSYINNLHPENHKDIYHILSELIARTIPLWNLSLTPVHRLSQGRFNPSRIKYTTCEYDPDPEYGPATDGPQEADFGNTDDFWEAREAWYQATRKVVLPEPEPYQPPKQKDSFNVNLWKDVKRGSLQVIVKLANIHLTPEKPEYEGGTWHVEGKLNEHICASAIYYYDSENITTSRLAFRQLCESMDIHIDYPQGQHDWLPAVFGCDPEGYNTQDVGTVDTPEGRLLTWPNLLQHQVQPFRLADPTKPGHRKIVALFLVDPHIRIISTANVPPQQREWWSTNIRQKQPLSNLTSLPLEVQNHIFESVDDFPISLEEAKALRAELMDERKRFVDGNISFAISVADFVHQESGLVSKTLTSLRRLHKSFTTGQLENIMPERNLASRSAGGRGLIRAAASALGGGGRSDFFSVGDVLEESGTNIDEMAHLGLDVTSKGGVTATFQVPGDITIPSDGNPHKVTVTQLQLEAEMSWVAVPKVDAGKVHLKAKVKNASEYTLLPGVANVYVDGSFISKSDVPLVSPQEDFDCPLGLDPSIRITYHPLTKSVSHQSSFVSKSTTTQTFSQSITVHNTKSVAIYNLKVCEQYPVSQDSQIVVKYLSPPLVMPTDFGSNMASAKEENAKALASVVVQPGVTAQWEGAEAGTQDVAMELPGRDGKFGFLCTVPSMGKQTLKVAWEVSAPLKMRVEGL